jgi:hypothetical protein
MTGIRAKHYSETEARLVEDPIVHAMAGGLLKTPREELAHDNGPDATPRHEFMGAANAEYRERGGKDGGHIGAVAHALLALLDEEPQQHFFELPDTIGMDGVLAVAHFRRCEIQPGVVLQSGKGKFRVVSIAERGAEDAPRLATVELLPTD